MSEWDNIECVVATIYCLQEVAVPASGAKEHLQFVFADYNTAQLHDADKMPNWWTQ